MPSIIIVNREEVNHIHGDKVIMSFVVNGIRGEVYNIEKVPSSTVYMLKTVLTEMTTYSVGQMFFYIVAVS